MEATFQPSVSSVRNKIALIEFIELSVIGFVLWGLLALIPSNTPESFGSLLSKLVGLEIIILGSWGLYNIYIRVARSLGKTFDVAIWVIGSMATGTYTFWAWTILDINRLLVRKLFYRGEAPVEFAWSWRSKQIRKTWEQINKVTAA